MIEAKITTKAFALHTTLSNTLQQRLLSALWKTQNYYSG